MENESLVIDDAIFWKSFEDNFSFVWPVNWGSFNLVDKMKEQFFQTSSGVNFTPFGINFL